MADEHWLDDLKNDPDLMPAAGDDVDQLIKSTLEEAFSSPQAEKLQTAATASKRATIRFFHM